MNQDTVTHLSMEAMLLTVKVSGPFLLAGLVVGLVISIIQAATQIQEPTLSFIPKLIATGVVVAIGGPWMLAQMTAYMRTLYTSIPTLVGG